MNDTTHTITAAIPGFSIPTGARGVLVVDNGDGTFTMNPVAHGKSVLDVRTELLDHLSSFPCSDEWLHEMRDYCDARLQARAQARGTGGIAIARAERRWEIAHVQAFAPLSFVA